MALLGEAVFGWSRRLAQKGMKQVVAGRQAGWGAVCWLLALPPTGAFLPPPANSPVFSRRNAVMNTIKMNDYREGHAATCRRKVCAVCRLPACPRCLVCTIPPPRALVRAL